MSDRVAGDLFLAGGALYGILTRPDVYDSDDVDRALARWRAVVDEHVHKPNERRRRLHSVPSTGDDSA